MGNRKRNFEKFQNSMFLKALFAPVVIFFKYNEETVKKDEWSRTN